MKFEFCEHCENVDRTEAELYCVEHDEYCEEIDKCYKMQKRYKVHVQVLMEADVYVYADNEDDAWDMVDDNVYPEDYCNETCGFDCDYEVENVSCGCNYMEIDSVEEVEE